MLILSALIFVALTLAVAGLYLWLAPTRAEQRLQVISGPTEKPDWTATVVKIAGPLAKLSTPEGEWDSSELRMRFFHAGIRSANARLFYFGAKTLLPLVLAGLAYVVLRGLSQSSGLTLVFYLLLSAMIGCYLPNLLLYLKIRSRQRAIFENFADAADLMLVCVEAGLGLDAGLSKVAEEIRRKSLALAEELHLTNLEMRAGATPGEIPAQSRVAHGSRGNQYIRDHVDSGRQVRHQHRRLAAGILRRPSPQASGSRGRKSRQGADQDAVPAGAVHLSVDHHGCSWSGADPGVPNPGPNAGRAQGEKMPTRRDPRSREPSPRDAGFYSRPLRSRT